MIYFIIYLKNILIIKKRNEESKLVQKGLSEGVNKTIFLPIYYLQNIK